MEKNKQYFHPFTNNILSSNEVKSIDTSYKNNGSKGTFDEYLTTKYFVKTGKLYPKLPHVASTNTGKYKKLAVKKPESNSGSEDEKEIPVLTKTKIESKKDQDEEKIPVLTRTKIESKKGEKETENIFVEEDSAPLELENNNESSDSESEDDSKNEYVNANSFKDSDLPKIEKRMYHKAPQESSPLKINGQDISSIPVSEKNFLVQKVDKNVGKNVTKAESENGSDSSSEDEDKPKSLYKTAEGKIKSKAFSSSSSDSDDSESESDEAPLVSFKKVQNKIKSKAFSSSSSSSSDSDDSESDEAPQVSFKTVQGKIKSNVKEDSPLINRSSVKSHIKEKKQSKHEMIDNSNIGLYISKFGGNTETKLSLIERLTKDEEEEKKQLIGKRESPSAMLQSSSIASLSSEKKKLFFKSALKIASKDMKEFLLKESANEDFATDLKNEIKAISVHLDSNTGAWKSTSSISTIQKSFNLLNVDKISKFGQNKDSGAIRFLSAAHTLLQASTASDSLRISNVINSSVSKTSQSSVVAKPLSPEVKSKTVVAEKKVETLYAVSKKNGNEGAAWFKKLYEKSVSDKRPFWDRLANSSPEAFVTLWKEVSAQLMLPLEVFWQHFFQTSKENKQASTENQKKLKHALIFCQHFIMLSAKKGNDDAISTLFLYSAAQNNDFYGSLRQKIYNYEQMKLGKALKKNKQENVYGRIVGYPEKEEGEEEEQYERVSSDSKITGNIFESLQASKSGFSKSVAISTIIPSREKKEFAWVHSGAFFKNETDFAKQIHQIIADKDHQSISDNARNLHRELVSAMKDSNVSVFGSRILLLLKFSFNSYNIISNWVAQGENSGVELGLSNSDGTFEKEIAELHEKNYQARAKLVGI